MRPDQSRDEALGMVLDVESFVRRDRSVGTTGNPAEFSKERNGSMTQEAKVEARIRTDVERDLAAAGKAGDLDKQVQYATELVALKKVEESIKKAKVVEAGKLCGKMIEDALRAPMKSFTAEIVKCGGVARAVFDTTVDPALLSVSVGEKATSTSTRSPGEGRRNLQGIFDEVATPEEQAEFAATAPGKPGDGARWTIKNRVVKAAGR